MTARLGRTMATTLSSTFHSFAYGLVRQHAPADVYSAPLRLLSAPEQDVVIQQLLEGNRADRLWPDSLSQAVGTKVCPRGPGGAGQGREKGLDPVDLKTIETSGALELVAAARFMQQYQVILDDQAAIDYPELILVVLLAEQPEVRAALRARFGHVFVDEYQDTDPSQVRLLRALAGDGRDLVVVGDPDQSIYGFRGADVRGILEFPDDFRHADGRGRHRRAACHPFRPQPAGRVPRRRLLPLRHRSHRRRHVPRLPQPAAGGERLRCRAGRGGHVRHRPGRDRARGDLLRRAHLEDGVPWSEMAVLVRSGRATIPRLRRSLGAAGVPVEVAGDDRASCRSPRWRAARRAPRRGQPPQRRHRPPRRLPRPQAGRGAGHDRHGARRDRGAGAGRGPRAARRRPSRPTPARRGHPGRRRCCCGRPCSTQVALGAARTRSRPGLATLLRRGRTHLDDGGTAEEVLWTLWDGTRWPQRLRGAIDAGGAATRHAHRDLGAICALFEVAARAEEQRGHTSVESFLSTLRAQQIPADTLAERGVRGEAVRLLTAHRSKGSSGGSSWSPTSRRRAGPTCADARRCCRPTGSVPTACCRR